MANLDAIRLSNLYMPASRQNAEAATHTGMQDDGVLQGSAVLYAVLPLSPSGQLHLEIGREIWTDRHDPHVHVSIPDVDCDVG